MTANMLHLISYGVATPLPCRYFFTLMNWNYAIHWVQVEKFIRLVRFFIRPSNLLEHIHSHAGCFYMTLGNIHPKFRSTLKSIQLLALVKNEHIKEYGMNAVLDKIIEDVAKLEKVCGSYTLYPT